MVATVTRYFTGDKPITCATRISVDTFRQLVRQLVTYLVSDILLKKIDFCQTNEYPAIKKKKEKKKRARWRSLAERYNTRLGLQGPYFKRCSLGPFFAWPTFQTIEIGM